MTPQQKVVDWALAQVGYVAGSNKANKYAAYMDKTGLYNGPKNGFDWCDVFADCDYASCFGVELAAKMTNQPMGGGGAGCWISAQCYRDAGQWSSAPQLASQAFFGPLGDEGHTGIVTRVGTETFDVTEGNTGYSQGYSGGAVLTHTYEIGTSAICGFGIPKWSLVRDGDWVKSGDLWWFRHHDGSYTKNGWEKIDGERYHFDDKGWMQVGWIQVGGKWYYLNPAKGKHEGQMMHDTVVNDGGYFYVLGSDGAMVTGSLKTGKEHDGHYGHIVIP